MVFSNKVYDKLKFVAQILLPALGTLYATVSGLNHWPNTEEVVGTIMAVDFFLGTILGLSTTQFNKNDPRNVGTLEVDNSSDVPKLTFNIETEDHASFADKDAVTFKVVPPAS
jgi:hypothetical protein